MSFVIFAMLLFMLISSSSMFEFHMLVAIVVMFNMLELILELLPNFPSVGATYCQKEKKGPRPRIVLVKLDQNCLIIYCWKIRQ